ncbi:hypothetical protein FHU10_1826 [Serratia fonticola]|uniref:Uncharacterized protein n=1 Tax=Serratia fonticola TaxID=47917 RepID=A0A542BHX7_SERFO|nr:hypothetical protein [Serratia fonticola]TQI78178.1 hypothetical protein FHU09_0625 [Serratia fonticola]TQI94824.1 hypothetical protein FHU11_0167 [Serratia fonticola]TVZ69322.1 hypothetical protein FHU10_1826 [Serratia fonticola]
MSLWKTLFSERGSLAPLWAIGGLLLVISIFWVENFSWVFLKKYQDLHLSNSLSRASLIENGGASSHLQQLVEAAGMASGSRSFSQIVSAASVEDMNAQSNEPRLVEPLAAKMTYNHSVDVPFEEVNKNVGIATSASLKTPNQSVKVFRPLNVILAIESSTTNRASMGRVITPLNNALQRLVEEARDTRINVIPYSYRVNVGGKCYTSIGRGDSFSFSWWEDFFLAEDRLVSLENSLTSAKNSLSNTNGSIISKNSEISLLRIQQKEYDVNSVEYRELQQRIEQLTREIGDLESRIPQLEDNIVYAQENVDKQQDQVNGLKDTEQYELYLALAKHYAKRYSNYKYFADYDDVVANSGIYAITKQNYLAAAGNLNSAPTSLSSLAVTRNQYFGDNYTCPSSQVSYNLSSVASVRSALNAIDYSAPDLNSLEGLLWAGRTIYGMSSTLSRDVVFAFITSHEDQNEPEELPGIREFCTTLKNAYGSKKSSKLVIVGPDNDAINKFSRFNCATTWYRDVGSIALDEIDGDFSEELEARFAFYLSQESTTKNVNAK